MSSAGREAELAAVKPALTPRDIRWQITPEWRSVLLEQHKLRWDDWRRAGLIQIVKKGAHRTVYRVDLPGQAFYLKHYHPEGRGAVIANLLRGSAARREWRNAQELLRRGLLTAEPIAFGETRGRRESIFVSRAICNSCTIDEFVATRLAELDADVRAGARRQVIVALAQLCAAAHRAGVEHADFHAGNVLVALDTLSPVQGAAELPRLYWIDVPKMRFSAPLDAKRSCASLAVLAAGWLQRTTRTERQRFWKTYLAARGDLLLYDARVTATEVVQAARAHARRILAGRDKRALATNRDFVRLSGKNYVAHAAQDSMPSDLQPWIRRALAEFSADPAALQTGARRAVTRQSEWIVADVLQAIDIHVIKPRRSLLPSFGLAPAIDQWLLANALRARQIRTPRPLCAVQPLDRRLPSFVVTEYLAATPLDDLLPGPAQTAELFRQDSRFEATRGEDARTFEIPPRVRRAVASAVGQLLGDLHAWNFRFFWLEAAAISISGLEAATEGDSRPIAWLMRLDHVELRKRLTGHDRGIELQTFLDSMILCRPSRTDCLRFLRAYLNCAALPSEEWKQLWRDVYLGSMYEEIVESQTQAQKQPLAEATVA